MEGIWKGYLFFQKWYINLGFPFIFSKIDLAQNKMEQQSRSPPNQGWSRTKGRYAPFSHIWFGGRRGGLGFPFILSKIDLAQNKMKQQTRSPPYQGRSSVKGKNTTFSYVWFGGRGRGRCKFAPCEGQERSIFPSLIWGKGGGGGSRFSILFCPRLKIPLTF